MRAGFCNLDCLGVEVWRDQGFKLFLDGVCWCCSSMLYRSLPLRGSIFVTSYI